MWNTALVIAAGLLRSNRPLSMISLEMKITSRSTANTCSFMPRIISPSTKACPGAFLISSLMPQAWRTSSTLEVLVTVEDFLGVVGFAAGIEHGQRALAKQRVEAAGARIEELLDLGLGQVFETAARSDARIHEIGNDDAGFQDLPFRLLSLVCGERVYPTGNLGTGT